MTQKKILAASLLLNFILAMFIGIVFIQFYSLKSQIEALKEENMLLNKEFNALKQKNEILQSQLDYYKTQADYYSTIYNKSVLIVEGILGESIVNIVAVKEVPLSFFEVSYEGVVMKVKVELKQGEGRILINTQPRVGIDLQTSARTAKLIAENFTKKSLDKTDVILTVIAESDVNVVDGPSAGAAITIAIISAILNKTLKNDIYITGTINPDGAIGWVGGIPEKAVAAAKQNAIKFLVPKGQKIISILKPEKKEPIPGVTIVTYKVEEIDLNEYLKEFGFKTEVIEVESIFEAYREFTS
ncbi:MAG: S16 family serine protease [Candidatus Bathyarchaeia archaeon]